MKLQERAWQTVESVVQSADRRREVATNLRDGARSLGVALLDQVVSRLAGADVHTTETPPPAQPGDPHPQRPATPMAPAPADSAEETAAPTGAKAADTTAEAAEANAARETDPTAEAAEANAARETDPTTEAAEANAARETDPTAVTPQPASDVAHTLIPQPTAPVDTATALSTPPTANRRPSLFGIDRVVLLPRPKQRAFAYWETDPQRLTDGPAQQGLLRLIDDTDGAIVAEAEVDAAQGRHYFDLPDAEHAFHAELLLSVEDGDPAALSKSAPIEPGAQCDASPA